MILPYFCIYYLHIEIGYLIFTILLRMKRKKLFNLKGLFTLVMSVCVLAVSAQNITVSGTVTDETGMTVIGATVVVAGNASHGTLTDIDGNYSLSNVPSDASLQFSYVGMVTQVISVKGQSTINLVMATDAKLLDEVVVVGFGTQKKVNVTGSVSAVSAKDIAARPINNVTEALQGVVPGMNFSTGSGGGALNSNKAFNIRGTGTIGAGSNATPLVLIDGMEGDINMINPQDIENISVLKDAAASSIYGSRAPAGVILITTKSGEEGKNVVNYNNNFRFISPLNMPKMADSYNFALYFNDAQPDGNMFSDAKLEQIKAYQKDNSAQSMWPTSSNKWEVWDNLELLPVGNTDWLKTHFGNSFTQEHSISLNGGTEKLQYFISGNYLNQGGLLNYGDDNKQRYSLNAKINSKLSEKVKIGYNARFVRSDYDAPSYMDGLFYHNVTRYWPIIPVTDPNGFYTGDSKIYQLTDGGRYTSQQDQLTQQLSFLVTPIEDWNINVELNYRTGNNFNHTDWLTTYAYDVNKNPYVYDNATSGVSEYAYKSNFFNTNIFTDYTSEFGDGHTLKGMVGFQSELYNDRSINASKNIVQSINHPTLNTAETNPQNTGGYGHWSTMGFFGRVNYDYVGKYLAEVNLRYDGTSRFLQDQRWNLFPSFSLGWNIAREEFFEDYTDVLSNFKLRASWGELGNQNTDNWYPFYRTIRYNKNNWGGYYLGEWLLGGKRPNIATEGSLVSALLTWERIRTTNVGLDITMLNGRLNGSFDWFRRQSLDMVGPAPELPATLGIGVPRVNNLNMESSGFELVLSWRDVIEDFNYGVTFNLADSKQKITKYPNPAKNLGDYYDGAYLGDIWGYTTINIAKTDEEMNNHLASLPNGGQSALGSNWMTGDIMFADIDGNGAIDGGEGTANKPGDRSIIGNSTPRYNFGLNLDGSWKGFDLKIFVQGVMKRDYMAGGMMFWGGDGGKWQSMVYEPHMDYFRNDANHPLGENLNAYYPRPNWNDGKNRRTQTKYLQNAAYARLKNVTLGYTLPAEFTQNCSVSNLRVFISGENLGTITKLSKMFDPEVLGVGGWGEGKTYPLSQTISVGLSVTL
mgnify:CR=1 FL=1|jgi:TonB-linked SusC/RagA family outer membrane protein